MIGSFFSTCLCDFCGEKKKSNEGTVSNHINFDIQLSYKTNYLYIFYNKSLGDVWFFRYKFKTIVINFLAIFNSREPKLVFLNLFNVNYIINKFDKT